MELTNINAQLKANQYLQETLAQVEKDFLMIGINFDIEKPAPDYKSLFSYSKKYPIYNSAINFILRKYLYSDQHISPQTL